MAANGYTVSLWGDENVLKLIVTMATQLCENILKTTELYDLNE